MSRLARSLLTLAVLASSSTAHAAFQSVSIAEIGVGFRGNPNVQFVELRLDAAGQTHFTDTRLTVFDKDGVATVLLLTPSDVANGANGRTVLYATAAFQAATGLAPDFVVPPAIVAPSGMVCWGAPGQVPPDPSTWDVGKPENYVDCVAYGGYAHPSRPASGTPSALLPGDGVRSLTRIKNTGASGSNDMDFALAAPRPCNDAAVCADLAPSPSATPSPSSTPAPDKAGATCRRAVITATTKFAAAYLRIVGACERLRLKGKVAGACPDAATATKIAAIDAKRTTAIVKACGALAPGDAGFGATCPGTTGSCSDALASVADVAACVGCGARRAGDALVATVYGAAPDPALLSCQLALGRAALGHARAVGALLARCEDGRARGKIAGPCPDPKIAAMIAARNAKLERAVCRACGGRDRRCDGNGDASPAALGIATCPTRSVPAGASCGSIAIGSLADVATCVECLSSFATSCTSAFAAAPESFPAACVAP